MYHGRRSRIVRRRGLAAVYSTSIANNRRGIDTVQHGEKTRLPWTERRPTRGAIQSTQNVLLPPQSQWVWGRDAPRTAGSPVEDCM